VSYEIDLWRRIANLNAATRADLLASEFARDTTRVAVVSSVAAAYFNLRALDQLLFVTERTLGTREKFAELTRAQFNRGVVSGLDVNRAEASLATARAAIPDLKSQIAQAETCCRYCWEKIPRRFCAKRRLMRSISRRRRKSRPDCRQRCSSGVPTCARWSTT
jgi:hypothetical protein